MGDVRALLLLLMVMVVVVVVVVVMVVVVVVMVVVVVVDIIIMTPWPTAIPAIAFVFVATQCKSTALLTKARLFGALHSLRELRLSRTPQLPRALFLPPPSFSWHQTR